MPGKVRVFVSSTMEDLANERQAVVAQIEDLGLIPVSAEALLPNGSTSWDLIAEEIRTSDIFLLLLGERYGWIPKEGAGAGSSKSVTHLETDLAREYGLTILPFLKHLKYNPAEVTDDIHRRDAFRKEIGDWKDGQFRAEFRLAADLAIKVRRCLLDIFQDSFLKRAVKQRSRLIHPSSVATPPFPEQMTSRERTLLFAGAGFSIAAGYPNANALAEVIGQRLGLNATGPEMLSRHSFAEIASFAEHRLGRECLVSIVKELLDTPVPVEPTPAHLYAVQAFPIILTTNYDLLFERACEKLGVRYSVVSPLSVSAEGASITIYKIDGSIDQPETLVLTHSDALRAGSTKSFWTDVQSLFQTYNVVVSGHSLRDATSQKLLESRNMNLAGTYVSPNLDELDAIRLHRFGLKGIAASANEYFSTRVE